MSHLDGRRPTTASESTVSEAGGAGPIDLALQGAENVRVLVIASVTSSVERDIVSAAAHAEGRSVEIIDARNPSLAHELDLDDVMVVPVSVVWLPGDGRRSLSVWDLLRWENPRRPRTRTQARLVAERSARHRVVAGQPALVDDLRRRWRDETGGAGGAAGFASFVRRRAEIALERAEREVLGGRYKAPRRVAEEIGDSTRFRAEVAALARQLDRPERDVLDEARTRLGKVAASQSRLATDVFDSVLAPVYDRAWTIDVDASSLEHLRELNRDRGLIFLPAHRSYADPLVLSRVLHDAGLPRNHTPGGNNLWRRPVEWWGFEV